MFYIFLYHVVDNVVKVGLGTKNAVLQNNIKNNSSKPSVLYKILQVGLEQGFYQMTPILSHMPSLRMLQD